MPTDSEYECEMVSKEWLLGKLRSDERDMILIDCRESSAYGVSHVRTAISFCIPSIMLRRLAAGKIDLCSTVQCAELKQRLAACARQGVFVLYGEGPRAPDAVHAVLLKRLKHDGVQVFCLEGDFSDFRRAFPEWCDDAGAQPPHLPLMGLRSLRISGGGGEEAPSSGSSDGEEPPAPQDFPVQILPNLFLGNSSNSEDCEALARHNIKYILNVTPDLPNAFASTPGLSYLQIPVADHWSQNLAVHFPTAIQFIEEAMAAGRGVLVHCVAGISRSVSVTLAYLMQRHRLSLRDAFDLVRSRKRDVAPNFHFLRQLHAFERELGLHEHSAPLAKVLAGLSAAQSAAATVSPDSGIEFDRWSARPPPQ